MTPIFDPFAILAAIFIAVSGAVGFGSAITFLIQVGKLFAPKWFPDESAQNWRVGVILLITIVLFVAGLTPNSHLTFEYLNTLSTSFAEFGALLMPLFVLLANWVSKGTYTSLLKGVWKIGKSYSDPAG